MNDQRTDTTKTQAHFPEVVVAETTALVPRTVEPTLAVLAERDDALAIMQREYEGLLARQTAAIALTDPTDWVGYQDREGGVVYEPRASAVKKAGGLFPFMVMPLDGAKELTPVAISVPTAGGEARGWRIEGRAVSQKLGREVTLEVTKLEGEDWTGRKLDGAGSVTTKRDVPAVSHEGDQRSAARTALELKAFKWFSGLTRVPPERLETVWTRLNPPKRMGGTGRGSGFGSAQARTAQAVQEPAVKEKADALWIDILRVTNGDSTKAGELLYDLTVAKSGEHQGKFGIKDPALFTKASNVEWAQKRLKNHNIYGDDAMKGA